MFVISEDQSLLEGVDSLKDSAMPLMLANEILVNTEKKEIAEDAVSIVVPGQCIRRKMRLDSRTGASAKRKKKKLTKEIARAKGMLSNERFVSKCSKGTIGKEKLEKYTHALRYKSVSQD